MLVQLRLLNRQEQRGAIIVCGLLHGRQVLQRGDDERALEPVTLAAQVGQVLLLASAEQNAWRRDARLLRNGIRGLPVHR